MKLLTEDCLAFIVGGRKKTKRPISKNFFLVIGSCVVTSFIMVVATVFVFAVISPRYGHLGRVH